MTNLAPHWTHDDIEALGGDFDGSLSSLCIMSLSFDFTRSGFAVGGNSNFGSQLTGNNGKDTTSTSQVTTALQAIQAQAHSHRSQSINIGNNSSSNSANGANNHGNNDSNNNENSSNNNVAERDTSSNHAQESMFGPEQASKQKFQYILAAPISAATKATEDTMTYLNQGQAYEIKLKNVSDISEGRKGFMCSIINIGFHERHMQQAENELWQQWSQQHPGERIFSVDMKLSYNVFGVESDGLNKYEFLWDSSKAAGVFIRINSISTEFTLRKHGGEKGIPFKLSIETFSYNSKTHDSYFISAACCQIKVFKPKGAERKIRSDRDKFLKRPPSEQDKYHRSSEHTMFSECPLSSLHPMVDGSLSFYRHSHGHFASKQIEQSASGTPAAIPSSGHHNHPNSDDVEHPDAGGSQQQTGNSSNDDGREQPAGEDDNDQQEQQQGQSSNNSESGGLETPVESGANQRDYNSSPARDDNCNLSGAPARVHTDYSTSRLMSAHTNSYNHHHQHHHHHRSHSMDDEEAQENCADQQHATSHNQSSGSEHSSHPGQQHPATTPTHEQLFQHHHHSQPPSMYHHHHHHHHQAARSVAGLTGNGPHPQPFNHHRVAYYNGHAALPALPSGHHHHHHISSHVASHSNPLHHLPTSFHPAANGVHLRAAGGNIATSSASYQRQTSASQHGLHHDRDSQRAFGFASSTSQQTASTGTTPFRASNLAISSSNSNPMNSSFHHSQPHHHFSSIHSQSLSGAEQQQMTHDEVRADGSFSQNDGHSFSELLTPGAFHRQRSASTSITSVVNPNGLHCSSYIGAANGRNSESIGGYNNIGDHNVLPQSGNVNNNNGSETYSNGSGASSSSYTSHNNSNNNSTTSNNNSANNNGNNNASSSNNTNNANNTNNNQLSAYETSSQHQRINQNDSPLSYCSKFRSLTTVGNQSYHSYGTSSSATSFNNQHIDNYTNQQHEPPGRFSFCLAHYAITINSSCSEVASWLMANRFGLFLKTFSNFCGSDLLRLSKKELIEICGLLDGIRLYNSLHNQPIKPKRVLYICNEGSEIFHPVYLYDITLRELLRELSAISANHLSRLLTASEQDEQHRRKKLLIDRSSSSDSRSSIGAMSSVGETSGAEDNNPQAASDGPSDEQHDTNNAMGPTQAITIYRLVIEGLASVKVVATDQVVQMLDDGSAWTLSLLTRESGLHDACLSVCRPPSSPLHSKKANKC